MDKNRARITIKLGQANENKRERDTPLPEQRIESAPEEKREWTESHEEIQSLTEETEPEPEPDEEVESLPATKEISASKESPDEFESFGSRYASFDDDERFSNRRFGGTSRSKSGRGKNAKGMMGVFTAVLGAVALGVIFGFIVLSFFKSGMLDNPSSETQPFSKTTEAEIAQTQPQETTESGAVSGEAKTMTVSITLPASTYYMVQGGVFQDQASAAPILEKIKSKGWPNSFSGEKPAYLFLGMAANRDQALAIANHFQEMDVYVKEFKVEPRTVSAELKQGATTNQEEWDQWFKQEQLFVSAIGNAIGKGLTNGKLDENQWKEITDAHRALLQYGRDWVNKLPESQQSLGNRLLNDYTKGVSAMERYRKQPEAGHLWQAEQALLDGFQSRTQLFSSFK